jgi:hypothetical protein
MFAWVCALVCALVSCNRAPCAGLHAQSDDPDAPTLTYVEMLPSQPNNPWGLVFGLSFEGGAGKVSDGNLLLYAGADMPNTLALQDAFAASALDFGATAGRIAVPLALAQGGVKDDTVVRLGFQLEDGQGRFSNCFSMDVHIDISNAPAQTSAQMSPARPHGASFQAASQAPGPRLRAHAVRAQACTPRYATPRLRIRESM